jgi:ATP synthase F0 subunit b
VVLKINNAFSQAQRRKGTQMMPAAAAALMLFLTAFCLLSPSFMHANEKEQHSGSGEEEHGREHAESPLASVWKWGNFIILFGGLGWYLRKPLSEFLETRGRAIEEGLANGRLARESALKQMSEIESRMSRLDADVRALRERAIEEAEEERARILEGAKIEAQKILELAQREIEGLKKSARLELKAHVAELAVRLAEQRLQKAVGPDQNKRLVLKFLDSLETKN